MEQALCDLDDVGNLESSTLEVPFSLKTAIWKLNLWFCKLWLGQPGTMCPPPKEERRAGKNELILQPLEPTAHNTNTSADGLLSPVTPDTPPPPSSTSSAVYSSPRIDRMMLTRSDFGTELEFEIESSKDHWSEVAPLSDDSELVAHDPQSFFQQGILAGEKCTQADLQSVRYVCDAMLMAMLFCRWPLRFDNSTVEYQWKVGRKIAEGAQAGIYEALPGPYNEHLHDQTFTKKYVLKVFREGYHARDLQRLWPKQVATGYSTLYTCPIRCGYLLLNGRFAFLMPRYWGDLRKFLDQRMQQRSDCTRPPCSDWEATRSMLYIAKGMRDLHISNIVHRDLKASNVLVEMIERSDSEKKKLQNKKVDTFYCRVADFESSKGVLGTGFWRAPEILLGVKHRCVTPDMFTKKSDVYSYAMTCYEIWTGCLPFENLKRNEYDIVLGGERPTLPPCLEPWIREMLERCWHVDPCKRPTFQEICDTIASCTKGVEEDWQQHDGDGEPNLTIDEVYDILEEDILEEDEPYISLTYL